MQDEREARAGAGGQEEARSRWDEFREEVEVAGNRLVEEVTRLIAEGNVRTIRIRSRHDDVILDVPMTAGAVVGGVVVLAAPWLAVLGAVAGLLSRVRVEVVRRADLPGEEPGEDGSGRD